MLNPPAGDSVLIRHVRAWLFNGCLRVAGFFLSLAGRLCGRDAVSTSPETVFPPGQLSQGAGDLNSSWQGQVA
jgi:hypothetical protein